MTRDEVFKRAQQVFRDVFGQDDLIIYDRTHSGDLEEWDSLNHINLISAIEQEFEIRFALGEIRRFKDVSSMIDLIMTKLEADNIT